MSDEIGFEAVLSQPLRVELLVLLWKATNYAGDRPPPAIPAAVTF